jgi:hypothetical protein
MTITDGNCFRNLGEKARKSVHDANNSLFVAQGFLDEIVLVIKGGEHLKPGFNKEEFLSMLDKVLMNLNKVGLQLKDLGQFARVDHFESLGEKNPDH